MIELCIIIPTIDDNNKTQNIINIVKKLGLNFNVINIENITKELIQNGDISSDVNISDLNKVVEFQDENRFLTKEEIKSYLFHRLAWIKLQNNIANNALILENDITLKEEFIENFEAKIREVTKNAPTLYSIISLFDSPKKNNNKYNVYLNYPNYTDFIQKAYIISKLGIKKMLTEHSLSPISKPINMTIYISRIFKKDLFVMKYPIFEIKKDSATKNEEIIPKILSLPTKNVNIPFNKIFIVKKNKSYFNSLNNFTNNFDITPLIFENDSDIWKKMINEEKTENDSALILKSSVSFDTLNFIKCLQKIGSELPVNYKFIGIPSEEYKINHPFRFSKYLDFIHPEMSKFSCYLLTRQGAKILQENNNKNICFLTREHNCFAYRNKIIIENDDF